MKVYLSESPLKTKRYRVTFENGRHVDFGSKLYSNYTMHNDSSRKKKYIKRHEKNEDWTLKGILTAGFWSRYLLWSKPTLEKSIKDLEQWSGIEIIIIK
jgi:hypothetical protein